MSNLGKCEREFVIVYAQGYFDSLGHPIKSTIASGALVSIYE